MEKIFDVALIGAGNLGSRHLQGLAIAKVPENIYVVEPNEESMAVAKERYGQVAGNDNVKNIEFLSDMKDLPKKLDFIIVATGARPRKAIVESIIENIDVEYLLLEKVVFQDPDDFDEMIPKLQAKGIKTYVNCVRRAFIFYQTLREKLINEKYVNMENDGGEWGLGCNSIHMLDMYAYVTGAKEFSIASDMLDNEIIESKRPGYKEFTGQITIQTEKGLMTLNSSYNDKPNLIFIHSEHYNITINEGEGKAYISSKESDFRHQTADINFLYQSGLSNLYVEDLYNNVTLPLTTIEDSAVLHKVLLNEFINHMNKNQEEKVKSCPIT